MNAAQIIDLVHETKTLTRRCWIVWVVVGTTNVNALCRTHTGAEFAANALFHSVFVTIQDVATMHALWLVDLFIFGVVVFTTKYAAA